MADWVMVPRERLEALSKLTKFNTSALAAQIAHEVNQWLAAAPQQTAMQQILDDQVKERAGRFVAENRQQTAEPVAYLYKDSRGWYRTDELVPRRPDSFPVYASPRITTAQVEEIKRLAYKVEDDAFNKAAAATDDDEWTAAALRLNEARAALHAALDALTKGTP